MYIRLQMWNMDVKDHVCGFSFLFWLGVVGRSCSNFLASTVGARPKDVINKKQKDLTKHGSWESSLSLGPWNQDVGPFCLRASLGPSGP